MGNRQKTVQIVMRQYHSPLYHIVCHDHTDHMIWEMVDRVQISMYQLSGDQVAIFQILKSCDLISSTLVPCTVNSLQKTTWLPEISFYAYKSQYFQYFSIFIFVLSSSKVSDLVNLQKRKISLIFHFRMNAISNQDMNKSCIAKVQRQQAGNSKTFDASDQGHSLFSCQEATLWKVTWSPESSGWT